MKSNPYNNVSDNVREVVSGLMHGADDYHRTHRARLARTIELIYQSRPTGRLLEIGTSGLVPVALAELLPDLEVHVTCLEDTPGLAETEVKMNERTRRVIAANVDLEFDELPFADETYDYVVCCEVLEHMEIDPMFMLEQVNRVTKADGVLLLTTPNVVSSRGLLKMLNGIEPYFYMQYHKNRAYHRHNYEYSARSLERLLRCAGFNGDIWTEDLFEDGITDIIEKLHGVGFKVENYGDNIIAKVRKISEVVERFPSGFYD